MPSDNNPLPKALHPQEEHDTNDPAQGFTCAGFWWRPETPNSTVPGTLRFDPADGLRLALLGSLTPFGGPTPRLPLLHGLSADAPGGQTVVTLEDCVELSSRLTVPGYATQVFNVARGFFGALLPSADTPFSEISFGLTHLRPWFGETGLTIQIAVLNDNPEPTVSAAYARPPIREVKEQGVAVGVGFSSHIEPQGQPPHSLEIREEPGFTVKVDAPLPLAGLYNNYVLATRDFLTLATDHLVGVRDLSVRSEAFRLQIAEGRSVQVPVRVWFRSKFRGEQAPVTLAPEQILLPYSELGESFPQVLFRWFRIADELRTVLDLYFGSIYNQEEFLHSKFLSLVQAVEAYHRIRIEPERPVEAEKQAFVASVLAQVRAEERARLKGMLMSSAGPSTADRLKDLVSAAALTMGPLLGSDTDLFVRRVVSTRNQLTHRYETRKDKTLEGRDLVYAAMMLTVLLQATLLGELGLAPDRCLECSRRGWRHERLSLLSKAGYFRGDANEGAAGPATTPAPSP